MAEHPTRPFFFVHVMKTAGLTLDRHIQANFPPDARYPTPGVDGPLDYMVIKRLRQAVRERRDQISIWRGHFPFFVVDLVPEAITLSVVREPVARSLSMLAQYREQNAPDQDLEALYEDPYVYDRMIHDHQTKVFSLDESDRAGTYLKPIACDERRLTTAKANLERLDLLGVQERFDRFLHELEHRFGWRIGGIDSVNVGGPADVPDSFRRRIAEDNALDLELYEHALALVG